MNPRREPDANDLEGCLITALDAEAKRAPLPRPEWDADVQTYVASGAENARGGNRSGRGPVRVALAAAGLLVVGGVAFVELGDPAERAVTSDDQQGTDSTEPTSTNEQDEIDAAEAASRAEAEAMLALAVAEARCRVGIHDRVSVPESIQGQRLGAAPGRPPLGVGESAVHWLRADGHVELRWASDGLPETADDLQTNTSQARYGTGPMQVTLWEGRQVAADGVATIESEPSRRPDLEIEVDDEPLAGPCAEALLAVTSEGATRVAALSLERLSTGDIAAQPGS